MKIIQIFNRYLDKGGEETSVARIAQHLEYGGHSVKRFWRSSSEWDNSRIFPRWKQSLLIGNNKDILDELSALNQEFKPDIWIVHNVIPVVSLGVYAVAKELGVPIVHWLHNYRPLSVSGVPPKSRAFPHLFECMNAAWRGSYIQTVVLALHYLKVKCRGEFDSVQVWVALSDSMKETFIEAKWFPDKLTTLHHSWDISDVVPCQTEQSYFLFLGRLIEEKGIRFLVYLFSQPDMAGYRLYIAGQGGLEIELKEISTPNIKWLGYVTGDAKRSLIRGSSGILFPSLWQEPLSTIAYEAYEQERCVITSSQGGMPEIVIDKVTGIVLPSGDTDQWKKTITSLSKSQLDEMGRFGRKWLVENVSPESWSAKFNEILRDNKLLPEAAPK